MVDLVAIHVIEVIGRTRRSMCHLQTKIIIIVSLEESVIIVVEFVVGSMLSRTNEVEVWRTEPTGSHPNIWILNPKTRG